MSEKGLSIRAMAEKVGVGRTQINNILKRKADVLVDFENNAPLDGRRKVRKTGNEDINKLCWEWFQDCTSRSICVSGPMIQEKALKFAKDLDIDTFKGSNGWLDSFLHRHNIVFKTMSGESGDVDSTVVSDWKAKLPRIYEGYDPKDVYNMDETGLIFKDSLSGKTFHEKGKDCSGGKRSKERVTVSVCSSMTGEKEPLLVIGKCERPRCFKGIDVSTLPVLYRFNKKAWMTSIIFSDWLNRFNRKMKRQGRHVLLFLDNAPSHPKVDLSNVKLKFFPPNTTSHLQPMDQGIIQTMKLKYRKRQLQFLITQMDRQKHLTGSQLLRHITLLDAIYWIKSAWSDVDTSTIVKCFSKAGFHTALPAPPTETPPQEDTPVADDDEDDDDDVPLAVIKMSRDIFGVEFKELCDVDSELCTSEDTLRDWDSNARLLLSTDKDDSSEEDDNVEEDVRNCDNVSVATALDCVEKLKQFALQCGNTEILSSIMVIDNSVSEIHTSASVYQPKISDFFVVRQDEVS